MERANQEHHKGGSSYPVAMQELRQRRDPDKESGNWPLISQQNRLPAHGLAFRLELKSGHPFWRSDRAVPKQPLLIRVAKATNSICVEVLLHCSQITL